MSNESRKSNEPALQGLARASTIEGYLALIIVSVLFIGWIGYAPPLPEPYGALVAISLWACGWLFAISGVRRAKGRARTAARVSLAVLLVSTAVIVIIALAQILRTHGRVEIRL